MCVIYDIRYTHSKIFGYGLAKCPPTGTFKNTNINKKKENKHRINA